jgi:PTH1 family peptidyl-tRNA hydrolase
MKYLIVGLGNIGPKYENTRHNIGFEVVNYLASGKDAVFTTDKQGDTAEIKHKGRKLILLKPGTYMNRSGKAVRYWMTKEDIPMDRLLVVVDDISLPLGKIRLKGKGSSGGHNGLENIQQLLGSSKYPRLRFGIGQDFPKGRQIEYVLGEWSAAEKDELKEAIPRAADAILSFCSIGLARTMNEFN